MSEDFGTVNIRRGERAREIEVLRQHYRQHREALVRMTADAPTEHLAIEYQKLIAEIDASLLKLDELEGVAPASAAPPPPPVQRPAVSSEPPPVRAQAEPSRLKTEPGMRPLVTPPGAADAEEDTATELPHSYSEPRSRLPLIIVLAVIALAVVGWLIWRASSERNAAGTVVEDTAATAPVTAEATEQPAAVADPLTITPPSHDYGTIRKGTRATRQFEISNTTDQPVTIQTSRSACRCLYYEHAEVVPPKGKETITVTIDAARAKAGELRETVKVTSKSDPSVSTSFDVTATIR